MTVLAKSAAAAAMLSCATLAMPGAAASGTAYVALGDSYSAGVGTRDQVDSCYRSPYGYAPLLAAAQGLSLHYQACSGATTADVQTNQLGPLNASTSFVTMTIGGNDAGFSAVMTTCALPSWMSNCAGAVASGVAVIDGLLPGRYDSLFTAIRTKAPNARVVIAGYPHLFNGQDCNLLTFFSPSDERLINNATDDLDSLEAGKANSHGFSFVDVRGPFTGHEVCGVDGEWINGLSYPLVESYHPNRAGNRAYAAVLAPALTGTPMRLAQVAPARTPARTTNDPLAFVDLTSRRSLDGARRAGLNPKELVRLNQDLHSGDAARIARAVARLRVLDRVAARHLQHASVR